MLELYDVYTVYGESHILHGVSLGVKKASVVALLGCNGMGKTTTVRSIVGFTPPRSGIIRFKETEVQGLPAHVICKMGIGLMPQGRLLFPSLSVKENLLIGARGRGWSLEKVYSMFYVLKMRTKHKGNLLSGGEQQMVCIARALMTNPDFLLMDEPCSIDCERGRSYRLSIEERRTLHFADRTERPFGLKGKRLCLCLVLWSNRTSVWSQRAC
jgi:branched-chain amino acid transport system ATP-binding protein